jgi:hypothetical protein
MRTQLGLMRQLMSRPFRAAWVQDDDETATDEGFMRSASR